MDNLKISSKIDIVDKRLNMIFKFLWFFSSMFLFGFYYYRQNYNNNNLNGFFGILIMTYAAVVVIFILYYILEEFPTFRSSNENIEEDFFYPLYLSLKYIILYLFFLSLIIYVIIARINININPDLFKHTASEEIHYVISLCFSPLIMLLIPEYKNFKNKYKYFLSSIVSYISLFLFFACVFHMGFIINPIITTFKTHAVCILMFYSIINFLYFRYIPQFINKLTENPSAIINSNIEGNANE